MCILDPSLANIWSELAWTIGFELRFSVDMGLVAPVGYSLGYSINMLLGLALCNYFGTWKGSLVGVSIGPLNGLIIDTR